MKDYSTKMSAGKLRNSVGNDATAGNAVKSKSVSPKFAGSKTGAVRNQGHRFQLTRTRSSGTSKRTRKG